MSKKNMKKIAKAMLTPFVTNVASVDEVSERSERACDRRVRSDDD